MTEGLLLHPQPASTLKQKALLDKHQNNSGTLSVSNVTSFRYSRADVDYSGTLNFNEWKNAMAQLGYNFMPGQDMQMFRQIDKDGSGTISEREFCEFWVFTRNGEIFLS